MTTSTKKEEAQEDRARLIAGILGLVIVVAFGAACIFVDTSRGTSPARVTVVTVDSKTLDDDHLEFTAEVKNAGDHTAEQVLVRGEVGDADPVDHEIDFLAPGEREEITLTAPAGTSSDDVLVSVLAWTESE